MDEFLEKLIATRHLAALARQRLDALDQALTTGDPLSIRIALGDVQVPLRNAEEVMSQAREF